MPPLKLLRQERFAQLYVELGNASEAYRQAYKYTGKNADINAHQILVRPSLNTRVAEIRRQKEEKAGLSKDEAIKLLGQIARHGERESDRIAAMDKIGKWCGWDQPTKVVVSADPFTDYLRQMRQVLLLRDQKLAAVTLPPAEQWSRRGHNIR
jgi:hypothetical protein